MDPFYEGYEAYCNGEILADNPYLSGTNDSMYWTNGFIQAKNDGCTL